MTKPAQWIDDEPFWLKGNFAPVKEETTAFELKVTGNIPPELDGRYFKNGANPPSGKSDHWFMGHGMIHGVEIINGKANWYRNRYVQTPVLHEENLTAMAFADPANSLANTHVVGHAGKVLALEESHLPIELTNELETVGPYTFDGKLKGNMTAHPRICPDTGELLFFGYGFFPPFLTYHRASATGELIQSEEIPVKAATMMHDFSVTRNYVIFMDLPMVWNLEQIMAGGEGLGANFEPEYGARLGIMPRNGTAKDLKWFDLDPCYVFHAMNAYEDGDEIVLDVCRMTGDMIADPYPNLYQWRANLKTGGVSERQIDDASIDFPCIPATLVGKPYRYSYVAEFSETGPECISYLKYDMHSGSKTRHKFQDGRVGAEPVFAPAENGSLEDDGYLLSYVYDPTENKSDLVIMDASNIEKEPIARIHLPVRAPAGFHGSWIPNPS